MLRKEFLPMPSPPCLSPPISSPASSFIITLTELVTPLPGDTHYSYGLGHLFHSLPSFAYMCRLAGKFWLPEITKLSLPLTMLKNQLIPPPLIPYLLLIYHSTTTSHYITSTIRFYLWAWITGKSSVIQKLGWLPLLHLTPLEHWPPCLWTNSWRHLLYLLTIIHLHLDIHQMQVEPSVLSKLLTQKVINSFSGVPCHYLSSPLSSPY